MSELLEISWKHLIDPTTGVGAVLYAIVMLLITWLLCRFTTRIVRRSEWLMTKLRAAVDETLLRWVVRIKNLLIMLSMGLIYASLVPSLQALVSTVLAGAGVTALIIGFAAKSTLANFISGLSLAIYRPIRIGDVVSLEAEYGTIEDITLRHTILRTWENKRLIIPNEKLDSMSVVNYSIVDKKAMCRVEFGVSYDTDLDLVKALLLDELNRCPHRAPDSEPPWVRVISHGDFSIGLRTYLWVPDMDAYWLARFWLLEEVKKRFDREGIEIPFPYRTLVYKKELPPPRLGTAVAP